MSSTMGAGQEKQIKAKEHAYSSRLSFGTDQSQARPTSLRQLALLTWQGGSRVTQSTASPFIIEPSTPINLVDGLAHWTPVC